MTASEQTADELCRLAQTCVARRDFPAAVRHYEDALQLNPDHIPATEGLAAVCFARKENLRAVELFKRVVALDPRRVDALVNLGAALNRNGEFKEAVQTLRKALSRDRRCAPAYYNLGFAERNVKQFSMAVSAFKEAIRLDPEMWEAYVNLGQTYLVMKNPTQAALNFERALRLHPQSASARAGLLESRNQIEASRRSISPFGRLVDMEEIEKTNAHMASETMAMAPHDQQFDRMTVHRIAYELEQCSLLLHTQVKAELETAVLNLAHHIEHDVKFWGPKIRSLKEAHERFMLMAQIVNAKLADLQKHEDAIQKIRTDKLANSTR